MIYVNVSGRLGNQLFYYALARKLQLHSGGEKGICFSFAFNRSKSETEILGFEDSLKYFNTVPYEVEDVSWWDLLKENSTRWQYMVAMKELGIQEWLEKYVFKKPIAFFLNVLDQCCNRLAGIYLYPHCIAEKSTEVKLNLGLSKRNNWFIKGRYENSKWFNDIRPYLIQELTPRFPRIETNAELYEVIEQGNSVCISIRRGDYLAPQNEGYFNVCSIDYFKRAIERMREQIQNPIWVLFSDDIEWVKSINLFGFGESVYYESGNDPVWEKLRLMYSCKHYIISNSTFSWWAQYLSRNEVDKVVISPDIWFKPNIVWPLIEDSFIKIQH